MGVVDSMWPLLLLLARSMGTGGPRWAPSSPPEMGPLAAAATRYINIADVFAAVTSDTIKHPHRQHNDPFHDERTRAGRDTICVWYCDKIYHPTAVKPMPPSMIGKCSPAS